MMILYVCDGEGPAIMDLDSLIDNFMASEAGVDPDNMRHDVEGRGWYHGVHDNGEFLVLNLKDKHIEPLVSPTPDAWDQYYADKSVVQP